MLAGGVLSSLVLAPLIVIFAANQSAPIAPVSDMLVRKMDLGMIRMNYILYIGAGAVTAGGILSMLKSLPLIVGSIRSGFRDLAASRAAGASGRVHRRAPSAICRSGSRWPAVWVWCWRSRPCRTWAWDFNWHGLLGAVLIVVFGFLFVTVSARLTGEIGSSSNPISGMTVATLLFTCLIFLFFDKTDKAATLSALSIAAIVCIATFERRHHGPGPEDRLSSRRDPIQPAIGDRDRRRHFGPGDRLDAAPAQ